MRKLCGTILAAVWLSLTVNAAEPTAGSIATVGISNAVQSVKPTRTHAFKAPAKMEMLRSGEVKPQGWLRDWCVTARNGYISRLDEVDKAFPRAWNRDFHPRGKYLDWTDPDKGAWCTEGGAYWFEGLVRLAWELDDEELKTYAKKRLEPLLEKMNPDAIGLVYWMDRNDPAHWREIENANHGFIVGASARTCRAFLAYYEATGDERALRAIIWCLDDPRVYFLGNTCSCPAAACDTWRYSGDDKLAKAIDNFCATPPYPDKWPAMRYGLPVCHDDLRMRERRNREDGATWDWRLQHGVLCYESMLSWIKASLWTGDGRYLANVRAWLDLHERVCRQPHGVIVSDEQFGWAGPNRGTETCTVAGDIMLHATLAGVTGEGRFADHVERSFFNAGAACTSRDFMHHVYFQSLNRTTGIGNFHAGPAGKGGLYKTKHWPLCCTSALTRILPGYVQWMWMKPASGGLAATLYAPNTLETELEGTSVRIETKTDYPFNETLEMKVTTAKPLMFPLKLRVPGWCVNPLIAVNGGTLGLPVGADGFAVVDREWKTGDTVSLRFQMTPKVETMRDFNDGGKPYCSLTCGPILFAYGIAEKDENTPKPGVRTDWKLDSSSVLDGAQVVREAMPAKWDWPLAAPLRLNVKSADGEALELVPYGCAKLRISMFPDMGCKHSAVSVRSKPQPSVVTGADSAPTDGVSRMESRTKDPTRDPGLFGDYWWANRFLSRHRLIEGFKGKTVDVVMLGDSIMHFWEWKHPKSWAKFTKGKSVFNLGYGGDKTENVIWRIEHGELDGYTAKCVVLMVGTNNNTSKSSDPAAVAEGVERIVAMIRARQPAAKLILHPIFPRGRSASSSHAEARARNDKTNALLKEFAERDGKVVWVNFNERLLDSSGWVPASLMADEIHPTDAGYDIWMDALAPHIQLSTSTVRNEGCVRRVDAPKRGSDWDIGPLRNFDDATRLIQAAIDEVFKAGGGRVDVGRGFYPIGGIRLRSGVTLGQRKRGCSRGLERLWRFQVSTSVNNGQIGNRKKS